MRLGGERRMEPRLGNKRTHALEIIIAVKDIPTYFK